MTLSPELIEQIKIHLNQIRNHLGRLPADERQEILQAIESHIYDALEARSDGTPTAALLDAIIAEMDPPDSYGELPSTPRKKSNRRWLAVFPALTVILLIAMGIIKMKSPTPEGSWIMVDIVPFSMERFTPGRTALNPDSFQVRITVFADGKTDQPDWTWKFRHFHFSDSNTNSKFFIKKIDGEDYLFIEWNGTSSKKTPYPLYHIYKKVPRQEHTDTQKGAPMKQSLTNTAVAVLAATNLCAAEFDLQEAIDNARNGATITVPAGTYTNPVSIDKPLTLKGENAILQVTGNHPAIKINTSRPITLRNLEINFQTTGEPVDGDLPYAVYSSGGDLLVENCFFKGSSKTPCAVLATEESSLTIRSCEFRGFNFTVQIGDKSTGTVEDSLFIGPGHCGITINGATGTLRRNIVTGSRYHAVRCTAGNITATENLILKNRNRGFYIGNRSSLATITDNLIVDNATGINIYASSKAEIANNVIIGSSYAGLANQDSATVSAEYNILINNERGATGFAARKGEESKAELDGKNLFFGNQTKAENIELSPKTVFEDPKFTDPENGLFSTKEKKFGLSDPAALQALWKKWEAATVR